MTHHTRFPVHTCAHQKVSPVWEKFEDFYQIDIDRIRDEACRFLKQFIKVSAPQRVPTEAGQR